jgi:WD40 repeat protein
MAFSPDGTQLAVGSRDGTVRLWDVHDKTTPILLGNFSGHRGVIEDLTFSPSGARLASASDDGSIGLWDTKGTIVGGAANAALATAFSPDGKTLAFSTPLSSGYVISLYSMPAQKLLAQLPTGGPAAPDGLAFSPDGKTLAVAPDVTTGTHTVQLWNVATHQMTGQLATGYTSVIYSIAFSPDGSMLAVSADGDPSIQIWSPTRLTRITSFTDSLLGGVFMVGFSPDGRLLTALGVDKRVDFFGVPGFSLLDGFQPPDATSSAASSLSFSPDGRELALGDADGNVYLYSVPATYTHLNGQVMYRGAFSANSQDILSVKFLSNDSLVAAGADSVVRFWDVPAGNFTVTTPAESLATHRGQIASVSYSASLGLLATASPSGSRVWDTNPARVAANICQTLKSPVSPVEWKEYLPDIPYSPVCS